MQDDVTDDDKLRIDRQTGNQGTAQRKTAQKIDRQTKRQASKYQTDGQTKPVRLMCEEGEEVENLGRDWFSQIEQKAS